MTQQKPEDDYNRVAIKEILSGGLTGFLAKQDDLFSAGQTVRNLYRFAWNEVYGSLFADEAEWRNEREPLQQVLGIFSTLWSHKGVPTLHDSTMLAFTGRWIKDRDSLYQRILHQDGEEDAYADEAMTADIEGICISGDLTGKFRSPRDLSQTLVNYGATVYLTWELMPSDDSISVVEAQIGVRSLVTNGAALDIS